jgi:hypothetical protein
MTTIAEVANEQKVIEKTNRDGSTSRFHLFAGYDPAGERRWVTIPGCCIRGFHFCDGQKISSRGEGPR